MERRDRIAAYNLAQARERERLAIPENINYIETDPDIARIARMSPELVPGEDSLRVSDGIIYRRSFEEAPLTQLEDGVEVRVKKRGQPQSKDARVIWTPHPTIENVLSAVTQIHDKFHKNGGEEVGRVVSVVDAVKDASLDFANGVIRPSNLEERAEEVAGVLAGSKFVDARKNNKKGVVTKVMKAMREDSWGRFNPSRSRWILSYAWMDLIDELVFDKMARDKYLLLSYELERERARQRYALGQASSLMGFVMNASISRKDFEDRVDELQAFVDENLSPRNISVNPYFYPATVARIVVNGPYDDKEEGRLQPFETPAEIDALFSRSAIRNMNRGESVKTRIGYAKQMLDTALHEGEVARTGEEVSPVGLYGRPNV